MDNTIDMTLYDQIKTKLLIKKEPIVFVSIVSSKIEELVFYSFQEPDDHYYDLLDEHWDNDKPYAAMYFSPEESAYCLRCKEFHRREDLITGKTTYFKISPYKKLPVDLEALKRELVEIGKLLGEPEAS